MGRGLNMASGISEDALKSQQSRIMNAMRDATKPNGMMDITQSLMNQSNGQGTYFDSMRKFGDEQSKRNIDAEVGIYNQMKEQVARGDLEAKGVDDAIKIVAGEDPKLYSALLQDLHADPDNVNAQNAKAKVMKYAAERGINPLSVQMDKAKIAKISKANNSAGGGGTGQLIDRVKNDNPDWNDTDALYFIQTGIRKGNKLKDGKIVPLEGSLKNVEDTELAKAKGKEKGKFQGSVQNELPKTIDNAENALKLLNELKTHTGLKQAIGKSSMLPIIPGTPAADFISRLEQVKGANFLQAYQTLKGAGQITEIEGMKAENAIARLQRSQTEEGFKKSIDDLQTIIEQGVKRAKDSAGKPTEKLRLIYNPATGDFE